MLESYLKMNKSYGFTLAEILIVLTVIGILTSILIPVAINSAPNEKIMKFKKGNATLGKVISELVNSDKYYADGDLGIRSTGILIDGSHEGDKAYFCNSFADVISTKSENCAGMENVYSDLTGQYVRIVSNDIKYWDSTTSSYEHYDAQTYIDDSCKNHATPGIQKEIVTSDDITFYQVYPNSTFGQITGNRGYCTLDEETGRCLKENARIFTNLKDNNMYTVYAAFCMDIDGVPENATKNDCVNECPFGYAIRHDGKILLGKRALEWQEKSIQEKN